MTDDVAPDCSSVHIPGQHLAARAVLVAITRTGALQAAELARQLPLASVCVAAGFAPLLTGLPNPVRAYSGALRDQIAGLLADFEQVVFFVALGAVVRLIAPHLKSKHEDPGVLVVDAAQRFVIPVLSGHVGGANAMAEQIAALLGAIPVLTTASDVGKTIAVDLLGRELGWKIEAPRINITRVSAHVVNGEPIAVVQEAGSANWWTRPTPLPATIHKFERFDDVDLSYFKAVLLITRAQVPDDRWRQLTERLVVYRPPPGQGACTVGRPQGAKARADVAQHAQCRAHQGTPVSGAVLQVSVGLGCDRDTPLATVAHTLDAALARAGLTREQVVVLASIDAKRDEAALTELAAQGRWPLRFFSAAELAGVPVPNPSAAVLRFIGTPSVSEAAALLASRSPAAQLLVEKFKFRGTDGRNATVSIASF